MTALLPTARLYHDDSYISTFEASVQAVQEHALALDQTALYPGGGGQMADRGTLSWDGRALPVVESRVVDGVIWHVIAPDADELPPVGARVQGAVDWPLRFHMMRTHTALHLLCGIMFRRYAAQVTGGQMYPDRARMDFSVEFFTPECVRDMHDAVNTAIREDHPIKVYQLPRDEAMRIPDLIRTKINLLPPDIERIRIVEIVGVDLQADGGTHVHSTREVGGVRINPKIENKGKQNKRMEITVVEGERA